MQVKSKSLSDAGWKDIVAKNKLKDNGLQKALEKLKRVDEDAHDEADRILDEIVKLATALKKDKAAAAAAKPIGEIVDAAAALQREVAKAKAEHDKAQKAKAEAEKKAAAEAARKGDDDEDEEEATPELLTTKLKPLLKLVAKGERMHALVAKSGKNVKVMLSRKPISPARRKMLTDALGGGSTKFYPGHCALEAGATTFTLKAEVAGLAKLLKPALLEQTGLKLNKIKCRGEDGDDDDGDDEEVPVGPGGEAPEDDEDVPVGPGGEAPPENRGDVPVGPGGEAPPQDGNVGMTRPFELSASVGRGGKNQPEDVQQVQAALNRRMNAGLNVDGQCGKGTIDAIMAFQKALGQSKPDGRVDPGRGTANEMAKSGKLPPPPPPPNPKAPPEDLGEPSVKHAPLVWKGTRGILDHNIKELKRAVRQEYSSEHPDLLKQIDQHVQRVDVILEKLDDRLADALERANAAADEAVRRAELDAAKAILREYTSFVQEEPLIDHVDNNPFGVDTKVRKVIGDSLKHMEKSMAKEGGR
ncbi:MAG: peptidoglycan-binding protein [Rubrivivax sp.]|nr:peptidoglycan-binding protein [Rubrivivax sp.]